MKRDNIDEKVKDFMARSDELVFVLRQQEALAAAAQGWGVTGALALGVVRRSAAWRKVVLALGLAINALLVLGSTSAGSTLTERAGSVLFRLEAAQLFAVLLMYSPSELVTSVHPAVALALTRQQQRSASFGAPRGALAITHARWGPRARWLRNAWRSAVGTALCGLCGLCGSARSRRARRRGRAAKRFDDNTSLVQLPRVAWGAYFMAQDERFLVVRPLAQTD